MRYTKYGKVTCSALCLALAIVLPFLTGQIPQIGKALSPMHIPVFLSGFICGWPYGLAVGFIAPLMRSLIVGAPVIFPTALVMAFELACYGFFSGFLYRIFPDKIPYTYITLAISMIAGRLVWGFLRFAVTGFNATAFPFSAFLAGAFTTAIPGIITHIIIVPNLVILLRKLKLFER